MRIAFVGKGGSGKTSLAAAFSRYLAHANAPVVAIDGDINQQLLSTAGAPAALIQGFPELGNDVVRLKEILRGANERIPSAEAMLKTTPPGAGSHLLRLSEPSPVWDRFSRQHDGIRFMVAGSLTDDDIGTTCYHAKTGAIELALNHLLDGNNEYVVVDMTAGADAFASGLFALFDLTCIVVEPTRASLHVYQQYREKALAQGVRIGVVANKVRSEDDLAFIRNHITDPLIATCRDSAWIRESERGGALPIDRLEEAQVHALEDIRAALDACTRDWKRYHALVVHFHEQNCVSWANAQAGHDLRTHIDPTFSYPV
jgi:CO dehydrogenase maturation factor